MSTRPDSPLLVRESKCYNNRKPSASYKEPYLILLLKEMDSEKHEYFETL